MTTAHATHEAVLDLERRALERWCRGDPDGFLEISAPDVIYIDPFIDRPILGILELTRYYEGVRGKISAARFELHDEHVHDLGDVALLTFRFDSFGGNEDTFRWNCTEVYRHREHRWQIIQTHWSFTQGKRASG